VLEINRDDELDIASEAREKRKNRVYNTYSNIHKHALRCGLNCIKISYTKNHLLTLH